MSLNNVAALAAVLAVLAGVSTPVSAQHEGNKMPGVSDTTKKKPATMPKAKASKASAKKKTTAKPRSASKASATKASATKASATKRPAAKKAVSATKKLPPTKPATTVTPSHSDSLHKAMSKPSADTMKMDAPHTGQASDPAGKMPMSQPAGASMPGASRVHSGHDMMSGPLSLSMDRM